MFKVVKHVSVELYEKKFIYTLFKVVKHVSVELYEEKCLIAAKSATHR